MVEYNYSTFRQDITNLVTKCHTIVMIKKYEKSFTWLLTESCKVTTVKLITASF